MTTDLINSPNIDFRDGRTNPRAGSAGLVTWEQAVAALAGTSSRLVVLANVMDEHPITPILLMPGNGYQFGYSVVNSDSYITLVWRERGATPAEVKAV